MSDKRKATKVCTKKPVCIHEGGIDPCVRGKSGQCLAQNRQYATAKRRGPQPTYPIAHCEHCGKSFKLTRTDKQHCSEKCRRAAYFIEHREEEILGMREYHKAHREQMNAKSRKWHRKHREYAISRMRKREHGASLEDCRAMWEKQDGRCANPGCRAQLTKPGEKSPLPNRAATDHCHDTGIVRALLCNGCNTALGMLKESYHRIVGLARYAHMCHHVRTQHSVFGTSPAERMLGKRLGRRETPGA